MDIDAVDFEKRVAIVGMDLVPISNMFDVYGNEINDPEECYAFVVGPLPDGSWLTSHVEHFYTPRNLVN